MSASKTSKRYPARGTRDEGMDEISGLGGGYEAACWGGLRAGLKWLDEHPTWKFKENTGLYDKRNKGLTDAIAAGCEPGGATGAMVGAVLSHVAHISWKGWEWWVEQMWKRAREVER
jgi:hypothetical protein